MNRKILYFVFAVCTAVMIGGCGIFFRPSYTPVRSYDLALPAKISVTGYKVAVLPFSSEAAARYKMVSRSGVQLYQDEYSRWVQTPAVMLTRYLRMALIDDNSVVRKNLPVYELSGAVLAFEFDKKTSTSLLCIRYTVTDKKTDTELRSGLLRYALPLDPAKPTPEAFAAAMSNAAEKLALDLNGIMKKLSAGK